MTFSYGLVFPSPVTAFQACRRHFYFVFLFLKDDVPFLCAVRFSQYSSMFSIFLTYFWKHQIDAERKSARKVVEFHPELSSRPHWWPKRWPMFVNILYIFVISGTVPTYGTAYVPNYDTSYVPTYGTVYLRTVLRSVWLFYEDPISPPPWATATSNKRANIQTSNFYILSWQSRGWK